MALGRWRRHTGGSSIGPRQLIGRAGYYIRLAVSPANDNEILVSNSSFCQSLDGGSTSTRNTGAATTTTSGSIPRTPIDFVITDDGGMDITTVHGRGFHRVYAADRPDVSRRRRRPGSVLLLQQHAGQRQHARARACRRLRARAGWDHGMGGCESGFTVPDTVDPNVVWASCYGNKVTRWDARYKKAHSVSPWQHHARLASQRGEIPLPLDVAAGDRSVRSQHGLLRLPGRVQDYQQRAKAGRLSVLTSRPRTRRTSFRRAALSVTTWGSSTAKWSLRSRHRSSERPDLGGHQRWQGLVHERWRRKLERTSRKKISGLPPLGTITSIAAVDL